MITKRTVLITASAIVIAAIAITAIFVMTSGISKADAENAASGYVPQGAEYIKQKRTERSTRSPTGTTASEESMR